MQEKRILAAVAAVLGITMVVLVYLNFIAGEPRGPGTSEPAASGPAPTSDLPHAPARAIEGSRLRVTLYFEGRDTDLLFPEIRDVPDAGSEVEEIRTVVEEIIKGPTKNLLPVVPADARLLDLFLLPGGLLGLNFNREMRTSHPGGSSCEIRTVYAVVDTIAINFPQVKSVQFLIDGRQEQTLAGHVAIRRPVRPDWSLLSIR